MEKDKILDQIKKIKESVEQCHDKRSNIQKQMKKLQHDYRRFGNFIQRSEDDIDALELKLKKLTTNQNKNE